MIIDDNGNKRLRTSLEMALDEIYVIDDVVSHRFQDVVENAMMDAPWYFESKSIAFVKENVTDELGSAIDINKHHQGFAHGMKEKGEVISDLYNLVSPIAYEAFSKIGIYVSDIFNARSFLLPPYANPPEVNGYHIDVEGGYPHIVCLYYVNDSDGDTILCEQTYDDIEGKGISLADGQSMMTIADRVTPKKGRCVLFNGNRYHSSTPPSKDHRIILNFDCE
jgi:hypothetical protein